MSIAGDSLDVPRRSRRIVIGLIGLCAFLVGWIGAGGGHQVLDRLRRLRTERAIRVIIREEWTAIASASSRPYVSDDRATLVEFADYQCPYCRLASAALDSAAAVGRISLTYRHLPLRDIHPAAEGAARSAICAEAQGHFRSMHHYLMTNSEWQHDTGWVAVARTVGNLDTLLFAQCLRSSTTDRRLAEDEEFAKQLHVMGTPSFFSRSGRYSGALTLPALSKLHSSSD